MSRGRGRGSRNATSGELVLNAAIVCAGAATAILLLSTLLRAAWPDLGSGRPWSHHQGSVRSLDGASPGTDWTPRSAGGEASRPGRVIRVQVLNGCGVSGVGADVASLLRQSGDIDVLDIGNAERFDFETTVVVDRTGKGAPARLVAHILGDPPIVLQRTIEERFDVTVIVGYDRARRLGPGSAVTGG